MMHRALTLLGTLALMACWSQAVSNSSLTMPHFIIEAAAAFAQLPPKFTAESSTLTVKKSQSLAEASSRLDTASQQMDQQDLLIERALESAQKAASQAYFEQNNPALSPAGRDKAAARFKRATDLIARLKAMRDRLAQNKQQASDLKARRPTPNHNGVPLQAAPKEFSESVSRLEDTQKLSMGETLQTARLAFSLQTPDIAKSASDDDTESRAEPPPPPPPPAPAPAPQPTTQGEINQGTQPSPPGSGAAPGSTSGSIPDPKSNSTPPPSQSPPSAVAPSPTSASPVPPSMGGQVSDWFSKLQQGDLEYRIPSTMFWKMSSTVTVRIVGPHASASSALPNATGSGAVKVADRMKVVLSSPENPDDFIITKQEGTDEVQFVPADGYTTWNWSVTPKYTGRSKKLSVNAWVLFPGPDEKVRLELPVYTADIDVHVPGLGESLKRLFEGDPDYWLRYGLPGGGGFIFVAGALAGLRKWLASRKSKDGKALSSAAK